MMLIESPSPIAFRGSEENPMVSTGLARISAISILREIYAKEAEMSLPTNKIANGMSHSPRDGDLENSTKTKWKTLAEQRVPTSPSSEFNRSILESQRSRSPSDSRPSVRPSVSGVASGGVFARRNIFRRKDSPLSTCLSTSLDACSQGKSVSKVSSGGSRDSKHSIPSTVMRAFTISSIRSMFSSMGKKISGSIQRKKGSFTRERRRDGTKKTSKHEAGGTADSHSESGRAVGGASATLLASCNCLSRRGLSSKISMSIPPPASRKKIRLRDGIESRPAPVIVAGDSVSTIPIPTIDSAPAAVGIELSSCATFFGEDNCSCCCLGNLKSECSQTASVKLLETKSLAAKAGEKEEEEKAVVSLSMLDFVDPPEVPQEGTSGRGSTQARIARTQTLTMRNSSLSTSDSGEVVDVDADTYTDAIAHASGAAPGTESDENSVSSGEDPESPKAGGARASLNGFHNRGKKPLPCETSKPKFSIFSDAETPKTLRRPAANALIRAEEQHREPCLPGSRFSDANHLPQSRPAEITELQHGASRVVPGEARWPAPQTPSGGGTTCRGASCTVLIAERERREFSGKIVIPQQRDSPRPRLTPRDKTTDKILASPEDRFASTSRKPSTRVLSRCETSASQFHDGVRVNPMFRVPSIVQRSPASLGLGCNPGSVVARRAPTAVDVSYRSATGMSYAGDNANASNAKVVERIVGRTPGRRLNKVAIYDESNKFVGTKMVESAFLEDDFKARFINRMMEAEIEADARFARRPRAQN